MLSTEGAGASALCEGGRRPAVCGAFDHAADHHCCTRGATDIALSLVRTDSHRVSRRSVTPTYLVVSLSLQNPFLLGDSQIVDAGFPPLHQAGRRKLPKFVAVGTEPLTAAVMPFVLKLDRHAVVSKTP